VLRLEGLVFCLFGALSQAKAFFVYLKVLKLQYFWFNCCVDEGTVSV